MQRGPALPALSLSIAACLAAPGSAAAGASVSLWGQSGGYDSVERFPSGAIANEENGDVGGQELRASLGDDHRRWTVRWQRWRDAVDYSGATQFGLPITTVTALTWTDFAGGLEWVTWHDGAWKTRVDAALGRRMIRRNILPTFFSTPLTETLDYNYALAAAGVDFTPIHSWTFSARTGMELALKSRLRADFHDAADPVTVATRRRASWVHELSLTKALNENAHFTLGWRRNVLRVGSSADVPYLINGQPTGSTVRYPGSIQRLDMLWLGVTIYWH